MLWSPVPRLDERLTPEATMSTDAKSAKHVRSAMFNFPNQLTSLRLLLSVVMFASSRGTAI